MAKDIEEFLRKAAERRKAQQQNKSGPAPSQRVQEMTQKQESESVPVEIVRPKKKKQTNARQRGSTVRQQESVAQHVQRHVNTTDIADHAEHLGDRIQAKEERTESRLKQKFDHNVGTSESRIPSSDSPAAKVTELESSQIARDLVAMFRSPQSIRQAVLISEILKRPQFD